MNQASVKPLLLLTLISLFPFMKLAAGMTEKKGWEMQARIVASIPEPTFPELKLTITDYGAVEGVVMYSSNSINKAIDACFSQGGGTVVVPTGVFYTGPIVLKSNVRLHLSDGATLKFSTNPDDYKPFVVSRWEGWDCINFHPLIYAYKQKNIAVTGRGILDGQANETNWWPWKGKTEYGWRQGVISQEWNEGKVSGRNRLADMENRQLPLSERVMTLEDRLRPPFIQFYQCSEVLISDVRIIQSPFWLIHPLLCKNVIVRGVTMESQGPNNDGCDPESSKNVLIENCLFNTGDDCIAIKSGRNKDGKRWNIPSENIIIRHCTMKNGHGGVVVGSEITGGCRFVWAEDCDMDSPLLDRMLRMKSNPIRGGKIENIFVRNIRVGQCAEAVFRVEMKYEGVVKGPNMPQIRNVFLSDVVSQKSAYGLWIDGFDNVTNVHNIQIRNSTFNNVAKPNSIVGAGKLIFENFRINGEVQN